jgi:hypothetical protein
MTGVRAAADDVKRHAGREVGKDPQKIFLVQQLRFLIFGVRTMAAILSTECLVCRCFCVGRAHHMSFGIEVGGREWVLAVPVQVRVWQRAYVWVLVCVCARVPGCKCFFVRARACLCMQLRVHLQPVQVQL